MFSRQLEQSYLIRLEPALAGGSPSLFRGSLRWRSQLFSIGLLKAGVVWTCVVPGQVDQVDYSACTNFWLSVNQAFHLENIPVAELAGDSLGISEESQLLDLQSLV